jgi:hypothetical protein
MGWRLWTTPHQMMRYLAVEALIWRVALQICKGYRACCYASIRGGISKWIYWVFAFLYCIGMTCGPWFNPEQIWQWINSISLLWNKESLWKSIHVRFVHLLFKYVEHEDKLLKIVENEGKLYSCSQTNLPRFLR